MKKNILIHFNEYHIKPTGGPAGYLYNLKKELEDKNISNIHFIEGEDKDKEKKALLHKMPKFVEKLYYFIARLKERKFLLGNSPKVTFS